MVEKYFDKKENRLVFINKAASSQFWDSHWNKFDVEQTIKSVLFNRLVLKPTRQYLLEGSRILEGGCGLGQNVWSLHNKGYDAYGVDYARETVEKVNAAVPELKVSCGDVRELKFEDDFFDGYWSIGVIEHFYKGFDTIVCEMKRVIKPGGYLFLTFPCMSNFRQKKAKQGKYRIWEENQELLSDFYQFALSADHVESEFVDKGFKLVQSKSISGLKGFKDETDFKLLKRLLQQLYNSKNLAGKALVWGLDQALAPFAGHCRFMIFKNLN